MIVHHNNVLLIIEAYFYNSVTTSPKTAGDEDFKPTTMDVTFQPGETGPKSIPINTVDDDVVEPREEFTVTLSSSSPGVTVGEPASVFIKDNDKPGRHSTMSNNQENIASLFIYGKCKSIFSSPGISKSML